MGNLEITNSKLVHSVFGLRSYFAPYRLRQLQHLELIAAVCLGMKLVRLGMKSVKVCMSTSLVGVSSLFSEDFSLGMIFIVGSDVFLVCRMFLVDGIKNNIVFALERWLTQQLMHAVLA